jgi:multiple sugar transport system permease protein
LTGFSPSRSELSSPRGRGLARLRPLRRRRSLWRGRLRGSSPLTPYLFLAPGFALYALVLLYPIARAFQISLYDWKILPGVASDFVGLDKYDRALHDPVFWHALGNSAVYMAATVPAQIVLGLAAAVLLDARMPGRGLLRVLFYLPVVTSWVVVSLLFKYLFSSDAGLVNWLLVDGTHVVDQNVGWLQHRWTAMAAISVLGVWKGIGWSMIIFLAALQSVPHELHEAAAIDGAGAWRRFRAVSLPAIRATVVFVAVMLVIGGFNVFISVYLMTGGGPAGETQVLLTYMYQQAFNFLDFGYGSSIAFTLTLIVLALSLAQLRLFRREPEAA